MDQPKTHKASIGIFQQSQEPEEHISCPYVPAELLEAAKRVIENKSKEVLKLSTGIYFIEYSPTGPFSIATTEEWLPVYIIKVLKWSSGGIRKSEFQEFTES